MINRIKNIINELEIENLMDYTCESNVGMDLASLYQNILIQAIDKDIKTYANEISSGKYEVFIVLNDKEVCFTSKAWDNKEVIEDNLIYVVNDLNIVAS